MFRVAGRVALRTSRRPSGLMTRTRLPLLRCPVQSMPRVRERRTASHTRPACAGSCVEGQHVATNCRLNFRTARASVSCSAWRAYSRVGRVSFGENRKAARFRLKVPMDSRSRNTIVDIARAVTSPASAAIGARHSSTPNATSSSAIGKAAAAMLDGIAERVVRIQARVVGRERALLCMMTPALGSAKIAETLEPS